MLKNDIDTCKSGKSERDQVISNLTKAVELNPNYAGASRTETAASETATKR